jgi:predicted helicase
MAKVYHYEIFGLREEKYNWLKKHNIKNVKWNKVVPHPDFYLFIPTDNKLANQYYSYLKITEIFPVNSVGIVTARDNFVIDFDKSALERRIRDFINPNIDDEIIKKSYDLSENQSWKIKEQREKLRKDLDWKDSITKILYRPFDERWILYHDDMVERTRKDVMQHMLKENIGLIAVRQVAEGIFNHTILTSNIIESRITLSNKGIAYLFPLYTYHQKKEKKKNPIIQLMLFEPKINYEKKVPNLNPVLLEELKTNYKKEVTPEEIFYYIYAVLYSNIYRTKFAEFLKIDFPRIPFTKDYKLFIKLGKLGQQLADLHLLKSDNLNNTISKFHSKGNNKVVKLEYKNEQVWINKEQYFDGIKKEVWQYQIGGYQVCDKWLKDRRGRTLTLDEIKTYCKIVTALSKTIEIQKEIDKYFEKVEKTV